ncbi:hypothetical protein ES706_03750 [subsurface metagenome]
MMGGSRQQKKNFEGCAHHGYGEFCHYCKQKKEGYDFRRDTMSREDYGKMKG